MVRVEIEKEKKRSYCFIRSNYNLLHVKKEIYNLQIINQIQYSSLINKSPFHSLLIFQTSMS